MTISLFLVLTVEFQRGKNRQEESQYPLHNEEDVARTAAAEMTRFEGKDTLRVTK